MDNPDSIMDMLDRKSNVTKAESSDGEEIFVPRKCAYCKSNVICSILPTFIGLSKIGILVGVEECPFYIPGKMDQQQEQKN